MILTRAGKNTPSDAYDSYREYRVANTMYSRIHMFLDAINLIRQCSTSFHSLIMLTIFINLIETNF